MDVSLAASRKLEEDGDLTRRWEEVDALALAEFVGEDDILAAVRADSREQGLPPIDVCPPTGRLLQILAQMQGAGRILEVGTLAGYSTIWLARALPPSGRLVTVDISPRHMEIACENFRRAGVEHLIETRVGAATDVLARLAAEGTEPFDLVFLDADKENLAAYIDLTWRLCRSGTVVIADNVVRNGAILHPETSDQRVTGALAGLRRLSRAREEGRITLTLVQTVGAKGYDGFAVARVR